MTLRPIHASLGCLALLLMVALASLLAGRVWLDPAEVARSLVAPVPDLPGLIVTEVRIPRTLLAMSIGAVLGLSGAVLQGLLRNPLADPGLLGVSSGAALGAVISIYHGLAASVALATPMMGMTGALVATALTLLLARGGGTLALILAGAAVSSVAGAGVSLALNLAPNPFAAYEIMTWLMGSVSDRNWDHIKLTGPFMAMGAFILLSTRRALDALALGEDTARSMGIDLPRVRLMALFGTALAVGAATSVSGIIGFIGLVAPHLVRPLVGYRPGSLLLPSALLGAALLLLADICTRIVLLGPEFKLGVVTALVGGPFFLWLVLHVRRTSP